MGEIKKVEYKQEWMDHLDVLYGSFIRRNEKIKLGNKN